MKEFLLLFHGIFLNNIYSCFSRTPSISFRSLSKRSSAMHLCYHLWWLSFWIIWSFWSFFWTVISSIEANIGKNRLGRKHKLGRNLKTKLEFLNINIIFQNAGKIFIAFKKPQFTIADSYDLNHWTAYWQQVSYSVSPLKPSVVF